MVLLSRLRVLEERNQAARPEDDPESWCFSLLTGQSENCKVYNEVQEPEGAEREEGGAHSSLPCQEGLRAKGAS
jgi:hypothetical protein